VLSFAVYFSGIIMTRILSALSLLFFVDCFCSAQSISITSPPAGDMFTVNDQVNAMARYEGRIVLGGHFTALAPTNGGISVLDPVSGNARPGFPSLTYLAAAVDDGQGGWYALGQLDRSQASNQPTHVVHFNPRGEMLDAWECPVRSSIPELVSVRCMAKQGDTLVIGGYFDTVRGVPRRNLALLNLQTHALLPLDLKVDSIVTAVAIDGRRLVIGGVFDSIDGARIPRMAKIDLTTGRPTTWVPSLVGYLNSDPSINVIRRFALHGNILFTQWGDVDIETGEPGAWHPAPEQNSTDSYYFAKISDFSVVDDTIVVAGAFNLMNGAVRHSLAAFDAVTGRLLDWDPNRGWLRPDPKSAFSYADIQAIGLSGRMLFLAGRFERFDTATCNGIVGIDLTSGAIVTRPPALPGQYDLKTIFAANDSGVLAQSLYASIGEPITRRIGFAEFVRSGRELTAWDPDLRSGTIERIGSTARGYLPTARVRTLLIDNGVLYVGGLFDSVGTTLRHCFAAFDLTTHRLLDFDPKVEGGDVWLVKLHDGVLYLAGQFTSVGGQLRHGLAAVDPATGNVLPWDPSPDGLVTSMAFDGERVFVAGQFDTIVGEERSGLAAIDRSSGHLLDQGVSLRPGSRATLVEIVGTRLYLCASGLPDAMMDDATALTLVALDKTTWGSLWPKHRNGYSFLSALSLLARDGTLIAAGSIEYPGNGMSVSVADGLYELDTANGDVIGTGPTTTTSVSESWALVPSGDTLFIGGQFMLLGNRRLTGFTRLDPAGSSRVLSDASESSISLRLFPNPARDRVVVDLPAGASSVRPDYARLIDVFGRVVASAPVIDGRAVLSTDGAPSGAYIVTADGIARSIVIAR
jgi:hypothetical protein